MFGIALSVAACLRARTRVDVAWLVGAHDLGAFDPADAVALTPGGGRMGSLLSGALDGQLAELAGRKSAEGRLLDLEVTPIEAVLAGMRAGGRVRCLLAPATELPAEIWPLLVDRQPLCLVSRVDRDIITSTAYFDSTSIGEAGDGAARRFRLGVASTEMVDGAVLTVLWPTPRLVVMGAGDIAEALCDAARLLGWQPTVASDPDMAVGLAAGLSRMDQLVVMGHDVEAVGRVLAAALASEVGYIGSLGSPRMQENRADWLAYRGVIDLDRIHGPAGLDIGARTPAEIAVSIVAEVLAVRNATAAQSSHGASAVPSTR